MAKEGTSSGAHSRSGDSRASKSKGRRQALEEELSIVRQELEFLQQGSALKERKLTKEIKELRELNHQLNGENDELAHDVQDLLRDNEEMYHELVASASHLKNLAKLNQEMETERDQLAEAFLELQANGNGGEGGGGGGESSSPNSHGVDEAEVERRIDVAVRKAEAKLQAEKANLADEVKSLKKSRDDLSRQVERLKMLLDLQKESDDEEEGGAAEKKTGNSQSNSTDHKAQRKKSKRHSNGEREREDDSLPLHQQEHGRTSSSRPSKTSSSSNEARRSNRDRATGTDSGFAHEEEGLDTGGGAEKAVSSGQRLSSTGASSSMRQSEPRKQPNPLVSAHKESLREKMKKSNNSHAKSGRNILNFSSPFGDWGGSGENPPGQGSGGGGPGRKEKEKEKPRSTGGKATNRKSSRTLSSRQQQQGYVDDNHVPTLEDPSKYPSLNGLGAGTSKRERRRN